MKAPLVKRIAASSLGVLVSLSAATWSMGHRGGMDHDPSRMLNHMAERLELSDSQREQVESIMDSGREQSAADRARLEELREQLKAMRDDFDAGKAQQYADEIGEITSRMVYRFSSSFAEVYRLLDDDQRAELEQFEQERDQRRGRWHKQPRGDKN